ncbi:MAG TPA: ComEC/Rec2 family competence protein [Acidobacteriota bacterium]|nr:ComEC/Rec2 family competence protein [Acidobacteriota bacterium]
MRTLARRLYHLEMALHRRLGRLRRFLLLNPCLLLAVLLTALVAAIGPPARPASQVDLQRTAEVEGGIAGRPQLLRGDLRLQVRPRSLRQSGRSVPYPHLLQVSLPWESSQPLPRGGDLVRFNAHLREPSFFATPGAPDFRRIFFLKGILHQVYLKSARQLRLTGPAATAFYGRPWKAVRELLSRYRDRRRQHLDPRAWKILAGVCLGLRPDWDDAEWRRLQRLGLIHLFVVSGLHVSLLLALLHRLLRRWGRAGTLLTLALLWTYVAASGAGVPALRAALMGTLFYLLWTEGLQRQPLNALGLAGLLVLICYPASLFQRGFQFSFLSLLAIGLFYLPRARLIDQACRGCADAGASNLRVERTPAQRLRRRMRFALEERLAFVPALWTRRPLRWLSALLRWTVPLTVISFFIQITTLPLVLEQSNRWLWTQVPSNLLLTPVISLMLPLGLLDLLLSGLPGADALSSWAVETWGILCYELMRTAEAGSVSSFLPHPRVWEAALYFLLLLIPHLALAGKARWGGYLALPLLLYLRLALAGMSPSPWPAELLAVTLIDVGQGEAIHLAYPGGSSAMVDTGGSWRSKGLFDFIGWRVTARYLWDIRSPALRYLLLTHEHSDHAGAAAVIQKLFSPATLFLSPGHPREGKRLYRGDFFHLEGVEHRVLHPSLQDRGSDANNRSLVLLLSHGQCSILLTGDVESAAERAIRHLLEPVTVLKVAHHGSAGSTSSPFLRAVGPHLALISAGRSNRFGHPSPSLLARLEDRAIPWYSTSTHGSLRWTSDGRQWNLAAYLGEARRFTSVAQGSCSPAAHERRDRLQLLGGQQVHTRLKFQ